MFGELMQKSFLKQMIWGKRVYLCWGCKAYIAGDWTSCLVHPK